MQRRAFPLPALRLNPADDPCVVMESRHEGGRGAVTDPFEIVHEGCYLAFRFGFRISDTPTGNLRVVEGIYMFASLGCYHPLEAALISVTASGDWLMDVATAVGVDPAWVMGFLDGFAQAGETSRGWDYAEGYRVAEELRLLRYRRELPDRR